MAFELNGHFDDNGLLVVYFEEVDVENVVLDGMELEVLEDGVALFAVDFEFDGEDVGGIDELAHCLVGYGDVGGDQALAVFDFNELFTGLESGGVGEGYDFAAIDDCGDFTCGTKGLGGFFAEVGTGFGAELKCFHLVWLINNVLLKIKLFH